jgi:hypothetical protein
MEVSNDDARVYINFRRIKELVAQGYLSYSLDDIPMNFRPNAGINRKEFQYFTPLSLNDFYEFLESIQDDAKAAAIAQKAGFFCRLEVE